MLQLGLDAEKIAMILTLPLEDVQAAINELRIQMEQTDSTLNSAATQVLPPNEEAKDN